MMHAKLALVLLLSGCGGGGDDDTHGDDDDDDSAACTDLDADGYGVGADCAGDDCDDANPAVWSAGDCEALCDVDPHSSGCACVARDFPGPEVCYTGPAQTSGLGDCRPGLRRCGDDGIWSPCDGQILPGEEACDGVDNDCDDAVDEEVTNECGTCGACERTCFGPGDGCAVWGDGDAGLIETPEGWLTLGGRTALLHVIWPSSTGSGEIFRVDTDTLTTEASFWTGPSGTSSSLSPSRSAVDDFGNVIISNRAFGIWASMTKIASEPDTCPDRNGNGIIDTSRSWDDRLDFDSADDWDDECILWHTVLGNAQNAVARALTIHQVFELDGGAVERGWVGLHTEQRFLEFDTETGELTGAEAPTPGYTPYGAAIDRDGILWMTGWPDLRVGSFDTADPENSFSTMSVPGGDSPLRVIVDENNVPWIGGWSDVHRYDRAGDEFDSVGLVAPPNSIGNIASDGRGSVWAGTYNSGQFVYRIDNDDALEYHTVDTPGVTTFGVAVDFEGRVWAMGGTNNGALIDPDTEESETVLEDCAGPCLNYPYIRGDITGLQRRNAQNPTGSWTGLFEGCGDDVETDWTQVVLDALTPAATAIAVSVRTAATVQALAQTPWIPVGSVPVDGVSLDLDEPLDAAGVTDLGFLGVRVILQNPEGGEAPVLRGIEARWVCPGSID